MGMKPSPGGRRVSRPETVQPCPQCSSSLGANYSTCPACHEAIESIWRADWLALLKEEKIIPGSAEEKLLAEMVVSEFGRHPWTIIDYAMTLLTCPECGRELGEMYPDCGTCSMVFGASILSEYGATGNEHALHIGRWILRFPHRNSQNIVTAWSMSVPRLLTGWLPSTEDAQSTMAMIRADRIEELRQGIQKVDEGIARGDLGAGSRPPASTKPSPVPGGLE